MACGTVHRNALQDPCCAWTGIDSPLYPYLPGSSPQDLLGWYGCICTEEVCVASLLGWILANSPAAADS